MKAAVCGPVAHRDDPASSDAAGERAIADGTAAGHEQIILRVLRVFGRSTTKQIAVCAQAMGYEFMNQVRVARRTKKMWEKGMVKRETFPGLPGRLSTGWRNRNFKFPISKCKLKTL